MSLISDFLGVTPRPDATRRGRRRDPEPLVLTEEEILREGLTLDEREFHPLTAEEKIEEAWEEAWQAELGAQEAADRARAEIEQTSLAEALRERAPGRRRPYTRDDFLAALRG